MPLIVMLGFGVLGSFTKIYGYQVGPVILGFIPSRLIDENWCRAIISDRESLGELLLGLLSNPLSLVLFIPVILIFVSQTPLGTKLKSLIPGRAKTPTA